MKKTIHTLALTLLASTLHAAPPTPPAGKQWAKIDSLSDEFDGNSLNTSKWTNNPPGWQGRAPARFKSNAVSVSGGNLRITNYKLNSPEQVNGTTYTMAGGRVVSKTASAFYGYYECRMKASEISMSSTFWMANNWDNPNACPRNRLELDIIETVGDKNTNFQTRMHSNTHYRRWECGATKEDFYSRGDSAALGNTSSSDFFTYGAWWVDANTIHFYLNNNYVYTVNPRTDFDSTPFDRAMQLNMVTETYDWLTPPTDGDFNNSNKSKTTLYQWVRSWKLEDASGGGITPPSSWTQLEFRHSSKCMDNKGLTANGSEYHQWSCGANANRNFRFEARGGGWWNIRSQKSNRCLDLANGSVADGAKLHQWDCSTGNPNQSWKVVDKGGGWFNLVSQKSNKCIDVSGVSSANQAKIHQWGCHGGNNQQMKYR